MLASQASVWAEDAHHPEKAGAAKPVTETPAEGAASDMHGKGMMSPRTLVGRGRTG